MSTMDACLARCAEWREPRPAGGQPDGFRLACRLTAPATTEEIAAAWPDRTLPAELRELWLTSRETDLFVDVDYGQWGLRLWSPATSAEQSARHRAELPDDLARSDVVVGEFLGDQELVVIDEYGAVLVTGPLDPRSDWYRPTADLADFLCRFIDAEGDKYWTSGVPG